MAELRIAVPDGEVTVRTRIVARMIELTKSALFDPNDATKGTLFDTVKKGNLDDITISDTPGCSIEEGSETIQPLISEIVDKTVRIYFNLKIINVKGVDPDPLINYYFNRIVQTFVTTTQHFQDDDGEDLALDIAEGGNSIQRNGQTDPQPGGTIYLDVDYRHARGDMSENR